MRGSRGLLRSLPTSLWKHTPKSKPDPPGWRLGMRLTTSSWTKMIKPTSPKKGATKITGKDPASEKMI
jgi:hypothetical protein